MPRTKYTPQKAPVSPAADDQRHSAPSSPRRVVGETSKDGNITYQDVRQIYSLWRRAEASLQQKTKELNELRNRTSHLKAAHVDFSTKLAALESVKQLSVQFQDQIAQLNLAVSEANERERKTVAVNERLQMQVDKLDEDRAKLAQELAAMQSALKNCEQENGRLLVLLQNEREAAQEEKRQREQAEMQQRKQAEAVEKLRDENAKLSVRNDMLEGRMGSLSSQLEDAAWQVESLFKHVHNQQSEACKDMEMKQEMEQLRMDNSRLVRLLFAVPEYKQFRLTWNDSDELAFVGPGRRTHGMGAESVEEMDAEQPLWESDDDGNMSIRPDGWFATSLAELGRSLAAAEGLNNEPDQTAPQRGWGEVMSMSASYPDDPFPLQSSIAELSSWVPRPVASLSRAFMEQTGIPKETIHEFLRKTNQEWYARELNHAKRIKDFYKAQLKDLQRQVQHAIPYSHIIAVKKAQRLEQELRAERAKKRRRSRTRSLGKPVQGDIASGNEQQTYNEMEKRSREQMLQASLSSLEQLSKRVQTMSQLSDPAGAVSDKAQLTELLESSPMPTRQFLTGAVWVSRNLGVIIEDLGETITAAQQQSKQTVSEAMQETADPDQLYRLVLLQFNSLMAEVEERMLDCRINLRSLMQTLLKLRPGDISKLRKIDQSLPVHCLPEEFYDQPQRTPRSRSPRRKNASSTDDPLMSTLLTKIQELQLLTTARKSVQFDDTLSGEAS